MATVAGGAAAATAVLAACLAVLATRPAATFVAAIGEVVLAMLLATLGAMGVASFSVRLEVERFGYLVIGVAFLATVALVYRLAGGLHSLGRRGLVLAAGATVLLLVVLVYTAALTRYGSPELVLQVRSCPGLGARPAGRRTPPVGGPDRHPRPGLGSVHALPTRARAGGSAPSAPPRQRP